MAYFAQENLVVTTSAGGAATATTVNAYTGYLHAINYVIDGTNPYSSSVVILVTATTSGITLWSQTLASNVSTLILPRAATSTTLGAASLFAAGGTAVTDRLPLAGETITVTITAGGNAKLGAFRFIVGG